MATFTAMTHALQPINTHQASHTFTAAPDPHPELEFGMDTRRAISSARHGVNLSDRNHQLPISELATAGLTVSPLVKP